MPRQRQPMSPAGSLFRALQEQKSALAELRAAEKKAKDARLLVEVATMRVNAEREQRGADAGREMDVYITDVVARLFRPDYRDVVKLALALHVTAATDEQIARPRTFVRRWARMFAMLHPLLVKRTARKTNSARELKHEEQHGAQTSTTNASARLARSAPALAAKAQPTSPEPAAPSTATDLRSPSSPRKTRRASAARAPRESRAASHGRSRGEG